MNRKLDAGTKLKAPCGISFATLAVLFLAVSMPVLAQTAQYDGDYVGMQTLVRDANNYRVCEGGPFQRVLHVRNGAVTYTYDPTFYKDLTGTVGADGTVTAFVPTANGGAKLEGKITGSDFVGKVGSAVCNFTLQLRKNP